MRVRTVPPLQTALPGQAAVLRVRPLPYLGRLLDATSSERGAGGRQSEARGEAGANYLVRGEQRHIVAISNIKIQNLIGVGFRTPD